MTRYTIFSTSGSPSIEEALEFAELRLLALKTNPESFRSNYERERQFTTETWISRLAGTERFTLIASARGDDTEKEKWVGTLSVLSPAFMESVQFVPPKGGKDTKFASFMMVGMWVHPDHRGVGLAKRLVEAGLDWVYRYSMEQEQDKCRRKLVLLEVHKNNEAAYSLYKRAGFRELDMAGGEVVWMTKELG